MYYGGDLAELFLAFAPRLHLAATAPAPTRTSQSGATEHCQLNGTPRRLRVVVWSGTFLQPAAVVAHIFGIKPGHATIGRHHLSLNATDCLTRRGWARCGRRAALATLGQMEHQIKRERVIESITKCRDAARVWEVALGSSPTAESATPAAS